ncbi:nitrite reductase large subunit [Marinihelvus fidelis]|uniref:Nitrite reductase large subunit n=1 Tax=Marinihelvus fidelis TaxID=2613842 RepID=A0A5N0T7L9_9GAMM|nr:nitrite reductase large subunit NirB [Marinihelvus fidelis]KAA9129816.1 nitrite reductase large subunit [Marinihelvus fidelis]
MSDKKTLLVAGNGMVGQHFLEAAVEAGLGERYDITVIGEEPRPAYDRVRLSEYFSGVGAEGLSLTTMEWFADNDITTCMGVKVDAIDRDGRRVTLSDGSVMHYDRLVLATGSYAFVPPIEGIDRPECFVYRTIEDLDAIIAAGGAARSGAVLGGGLLGLEAANALKNLGLDAHVIQFASTLMEVQLDGDGGRMLESKIGDLGVKVRTNSNTRAIVDGDDHRLRLEFADGGHLETDLVVVSTGIRPRDELCEACGLERGERGGFAVDDQCRTSDPAIYAIGECAAWNGRVFGLVAPGYEMARVAAGALADEPRTFAGADMSTKLKLLGVDVASIGDSLGRTAGAQTYAFTDGPAGIYRRIVVNAEGNRLLGAVLVGDTEPYSNWLQYCINDMPLPDQPEGLLISGVDGEAGGLSAGALPDTAQVCSCHNVSKGGICNAVDDGATTLGDLKACTKATTGCGGCTQLVTQILNMELESRGVAVDRSLCEHFPYTRQELYHLVRVEEHQTFESVLEKHGKGLGCDVCKPTVGSILASCWNAYVLGDDTAQLQDTNDYYLANMQKNGTYSVVPRVPGGEITPEKLIVLGEVAKKYDLYTKITGGQRIDLFGATVEQLPEIWRELIDAGFETGQAYGKSVRTVKSCVGSTWCRYGLLDSVGMSLRIENRYKGLRAPHKLKFAVSGCTRECAEAQSKDVGVIATENGWNLYVCGNGGMRPRHADLFATGLDNDALIQAIDRFLMFYIRTGDRLQRTSVWLENLEGGLDYLREVVLEDSLGIAAQLESEMRDVVDTYECEWKRTVEDPERLRRFRSFVNSDRTDPSLRFTRERGQRRPADADEQVVQSIPLVEVSA